MEKITGNEPATALVTRGGTISDGLTIRQHFSAMMLQGLVTLSSHQATHEEHAKQAVAYADALITELNK